MAKIDKLRTETFKDAIRLLEEHGKVVIIRPTGFGKTGILCRMTKHYKNKKILFLYPAQVVRQAMLNFYHGVGSDKTEIPNVTFMTYDKFRNLKEDEMKEQLSDYDIVMSDECHRLGGDKIKVAYKKFIEMFPDILQIGATATPERMDLFDEISIFYDNHVVFEYTLHNAFQDGILQRPYYCFCSHGGSDLKDIDYETRLEIDKMGARAKGRPEALKLLKSRLIEISNLSKMENIIKTTCKECLGDNTSYMKFIVFFSDYDHIKDKGNDVVDWFQKAYPSYSINVLRVTSDSSKYAKNVNKLGTLVPRPNTVDLVYCVDMLNMGYHVSDLTGIMMYRGTHSGIIYAQQLGRVLSTGSLQSGIVFDVVDNIHRESMYIVLDEETKALKRTRLRIKKLEKKINEGKATDKEIQEYQELLSGAEAEKRTRWWTASVIDPKDLISTGYEATYRELIAKTVAEQRSMRARQAYQRWKERGGDDSIKTREYILSREAPDFVPLPPFCYLKQVSIDEVLNEMGIK